MQYRMSEALGADARVYSASSLPADRTRTDEFLSAVKVACVLYYVAYYLLIPIIFSKALGLFAGSDKEVVSRALELSVLLVEGVNVFALLRSVPKVRPPEFWVLFVNAVWVLVTRFLLGVPVPLKVDDVVFFTLLMFLVLATVINLSGAWRQRLLTLMTLEIVCVTTVWGLGGLIAVVQGSYAQGFKWVTILPEGGAPRDLYVKLFDYNRNLTAAFFLVAAGLLINR